MRTRTQPERVTTATVEDTANGPVLVYKALDRVPDAIINPDRLLHMAKDEQYILENRTEAAAEQITEEERRDLQHVIDLCERHATRHYPTSRQAVQNACAPRA